MEAINLAGSTVGILAEDGVILAGEKKTTSKLLDQASGVGWGCCRESGGGKVQLVAMVGNIAVTNTCCHGIVYSNPLHWKISPNTSQYLFYQVTMD